MARSRECHGAASPCATLDGSAMCANSRSRCLVRSHQTGTSAYTTTSRTVFRYGRAGRSGCPAVPVVEQRRKARNRARAWRERRLRLTVPAGSATPAKMLGPLWQRSPPSSQSLRALRRALRFSPSPRRLPSRASGRRIDVRTSRTTALPSGQRIARRDAPGRDIVRRSGCKGSSERARLARSRI